MSKITTEHCKEFIVNHFNNNGINTSIKDWKRTSKYKQDDLLLRDFFHTTLGLITLVEKNDLLEILDGQKQQENNEPSYFKKFSKEEINGAKKIVKKLIKIREEQDDDDLVFESAEWRKYCHALPSQFTFYFPFDNPNEVYHNDKNNVMNGLDSYMFFNSYKSFNIMFSDKNTNDIDLYTSDCLNNNISGILPPWTHFIDEYHVEVTNDAPLNLTVRQFINIMFELGFEYQVGEIYDCLFNQEIIDYLDELKQQNSKPKIKNK